MSRSRFALVYVLAWTPVAVLYAIVLRSQRGMDLESSLWGSGVTIGTAAVLGLGAWAASRRIRYEPGRRVRFFALHALLSACYSGLWFAEVATTIRFRAPADTFERFIEEATGWQLLYGMALYGLIVGIAYAVHAVRRLGEEEQRTARAEALRVDAELRALRAQLNPHFLFNTLHSITALVRIDPAAGERALEGFATLLRYVLDVNRATREEVPVEDEIGFVRTYLALERLRLGDRLRVIEEIEPDALECLVLSFSLQPLVENAVRHGIAPRAAGGTVRIAARVEDEHLLLEVADDGGGADPAQLAATTGLGLQAVRQRLETRYGAAVVMEIVTAPRNGFLVRMAVPASVRTAVRGAPTERRLPMAPASDRAAHGAAR